LIDGGAWNERSAPVTPDDVADYGAGESVVNPALAGFASPSSTGWADAERMNA